MGTAPVGTEHVSFVYQFPTVDQLVSIFPHHTWYEYENVDDAETVVLFVSVQQGFGQFVEVGSGSYTTMFPGTDEAGRNTYPSGTPYVSGNALGKPVPTSDWWSALSGSPDCPF